MYKVIRSFHDLQDSVATKNGAVYHAYSVGDTYPRDGYKATEDRIAELAGPDNAQGTPLIESVAEPHAAAEPKAAAEKRKKKAE